MQLYHIIFNNLRRRKAKMFFMLIGIIIGISTIISVYNVINSMKAQMTKQVSEFGVNVVITPDSGGLTFSYGGIVLPEIMYDVEQLTNQDVTIINELQNNEMIRIISPKLINVDMLSNGHKITVIGSNLKQEFQIKPWLTVQDNRMEDNKDLTDKALENQSNQVASSEGEKEMEFTLIDLYRQDLEKIDLTNDEIIMGNALAMALKLDQGDKITISGKEYEIKFILTENGEAEDNQILMNLEEAQTVFNKTDEITMIDLSVDYVVGSEEALISEINEKLPHTQVSSLRQETLRRDEMLNRLVRFGVAISVLIILIGMLVVGITMSGSVRERTREIGIFRAIGFRKSHIIKIILAEAFVISLIGGIAGYLIGNLIAGYAGPIFIGDTIQAEWNILILLLSVVLSVVIGLISSIMPALKAAKLDPAEALRFI